MSRSAILLMVLVIGLTRTWTACHGAESIIRDIRFENRGHGQLDTSVIETHTKARKGATLARNTLAHDVRELLETGLFTDVSVSVLPVEDGVAVVYGFINRWTLTAPVRVEGHEKFREKRVREILGLSPGDLVDDQVLGARTRKLVEEYRRYHYNDVQVSWKLIPVNEREGHATVALIIQESGKQKVKTFRMHGNKHIATRDLLDAVRYPNWWNPFRYFKGLDHDSDDLAMYRASIQDAYLDQGYLDVQVDVRGVTRRAKGKAVISVYITEGNRYTISQTSISGVDLFPLSDVQRALALKVRPGAIASMRTIADGASAMRDYYEDKGYLGTRVAPTLTPHTGSLTVDIHYTVTEGRLTHLRNVTILGNDRTKDKVLRRELLVYPGEVYNGVKVRRSENRLRNLGFFSRVSTFPIDTALEDQKDLLVEVEEKPTGHFMVGAGFSSVDNAIGFLEISQGNFDITNWPRFTGDGQKLRLRGEFGSTRTEYELSFLEPWFLDRQLALGFDVYRSEVDYDEYELTRTGFSPYLAKALPGRNRIELRYRIEDRVVDDSSDTNEYIVVESGEPYTFDRDESTLQSSFRVTVSHDSRDQAFVPTRGLRASIFAEMAGGPAGGDSDLYRLGTRADQYVKPWLRHVIALQFRYEVVEPYGDTDELSISDRLFIGGGRTLRGFEYRDVGPKAVPADPLVATDYRPIGGKSLAFASAEYTIPIVKGIRLAAFFDVGNVWSDSYELDPSDVATSTGVGLRFDLPGFPIRIDRAWVVDPDDELTDDDPWVFWIGY